MNISLGESRSWDECFLKFLEPKKKKYIKKWCVLCLNAAENYSPVAECCMLQFVNLAARYLRGDTRRFNKTTQWNLVTCLNGKYFLETKLLF